MTVSLINKVIKKLQSNEGVIPVIPITDSIKLVEKNKIIKNLDRNKIFVSQTHRDLI